MFNKVKRSVLELIEKNKTNEVTSKTQKKNNGIYMLYVDDFSDDKIIPFYIGQTVDLQDRYKNHYVELLALNRLMYAVYRHHMFKPSALNGCSSYYDGHLKTCKIFKYMVEHNCTLENFHMIAIEENIEDLETVEQQYFEKYLPAFFGFNQLNTTSEMRKCLPPDKMQSYMIADGRNLLQYMDYGFSRFNYVHAFPKQTSEEYSDELNSLIISLSEYYDSNEYSSVREEYIAASREFSNKSSEVFRSISKLLGTDLDGYFAENSLKSRTKYNMIIEQLTKEQPNLEEVIKYVKRYSKDGGAGLYKILEKYDGLISLWRESLRELKEINDSCFEKYYAVGKRTFDMIFPQIEYLPYPLKAKYKPYEFPDEITSLRENVCQICIDYTMDRTKNTYDLYIDTTPLRIAFRYFGDSNEIIQDEFFIQTGLERMFDEDKHDKIYYIEHKPLMSFFAKPFNPVCVGCNAMITPNIEYKTGINEYVLANAKTLLWQDAFNHINQYINANTVIMLYSCTEGIKSKLSDLRYVDGLKHNLLVQKLLKIVRRKR